ncbi:hypothetical protein TNCV_2132511 [Trichonephila clavipes]|nr:hypothetical protein TNCV_2132511 [Trichonephila clavipes]
MFSAVILSSAIKKGIIVLLCPLVQNDNGATMLTGILHSNDYEERRVRSFVEVLMTIPHSVLDSSSVAKS